MQKEFQKESRRRGKLQGREQLKAALALCKADSSPMDGTGAENVAVLNSSISWMVTALPRLLPCSSRATWGGLGRGWC